MIKNHKFLSLILSFALYACNQNTNSQTVTNLHSIIKPDRNTIISRFNPPQGYEREKYDSGTYGYFLQHLELKNIHLCILINIIYVGKSDL